MYTHIRNWLLIIGLVGLTGCATIFTSSTQKLNIQIIEVGSGALVSDCHCIVSDGIGGQVTLSSNPGYVIMNRGGNIQVTCNKVGYRQVDTLVGNSFSGATLVNILFWPGFLVDAATGAYKKYPSHYVVKMERLDAPQTLAKVNPNTAPVSTPLSVEAQTPTQNTPVISAPQAALVQP